MSTVPKTLEKNNSSGSHCSHCSHCAHCSHCSHYSHCRAALGSWGSRSQAHRGPHGARVTATGADECKASSSDRLTEQKQVCHQLLCGEHKETELTAVEVCKWKVCEPTGK
ncbi:unnamed protein product [Pleuronectes platessa]|uniref:Uncharacterized protein n=1 Tax=Pleuronectes platessa TaxID=8262 RepID=A0A9N7UJ28_PLEPL|nr:unnamed protein product [Pleuronectes platessa]